MKRNEVVPIDNNLNPRPISTHFNANLQKESVLELYCCGVLSPSFWDESIDSVGEEAIENCMLRMNEF